MVKGLRGIDKASNKRVHHPPPLHCDTRLAFSTREGFYMFFPRRLTSIFSYVRYIITQWRHFFCRYSPASFTPSSAGGGVTGARFASLARLTVEIQVMSRFNREKNKIGFSKIDLNLIEVSLQFVADLITDMSHLPYRRTAKSVFFRME